MRHLGYQRLQPLPDVPPGDVGLTTHLDELETLAEGLNDTIKAIAEELEIKPAILKRAIKLAHKAEFGRAQQDHEILEQILTTVGKTL